ncbi:peptidoglycan editing factor PgeF [Terracidiphilus gabretensis]|uniref:peptidoglycan editing factor PgeF n=1 Tax=Terracidiphilus gabretensis TaxID=1577687 RepID=UPI0009E7802F|nr:peptidoglycan editing factor PgeF [Terracidiphilus gabretensis]
MPSSIPITRSVSALAKSAGAESLIEAQIDARIEDQIEQVDALFSAAGLVRGQTEKAAGGRKTTPRHDLSNKSPDDLRPAAAEPIHAGNGVEWVSAPALKRISWLWHGFSTRRGGMSTAYAAEGEPAELNLGFTADDTREHVLRNRELFAEAITGNASTPIVTIRQIHSSMVAVADSSHIGQPCEGDGLMTDKPGLLLGILTADCTPVLVTDRKKKVVAAFHAGWRGTVKRIVESGIGRMRLEFGSDPEDLVAAIGPSIGPCCYAVGEDVFSEFTSQFAYAPELFHEVYDSDSVKQEYPLLFLTQRAPGDSSQGPGLHLDVAEANRRQLLDAGLKPRNISMVGGCTRCQPELFFSHRGSQGRAGRMLSVVGIRG